MNNFIITRNDNSEKKYLVGISKSGDNWTSLRDHAHRFSNYDEALKLLEDHHTKDYLRMCLIRVENG